MKFIYCILIVVPIAFPIFFTIESTSVNSKYAETEKKLASQMETELNNLKRIYKLNFEVITKQMPNCGKNCSEFTEKFEVSWICNKKLCQLYSFTFTIEYERNGRQGN